jgi:hypothetical protein
MNRRHVLIWATLITVFWIGWHYDAKHNEWNFGRGLWAVETLNEEGWYVKKPITPVNVLIDAAGLVAPLMILCVWYRRTLGR